MDLLTSESVTEGHPDKVCDQIADAILDYILGRDPEARVAIEALFKGDLLVIAGETSFSQDLPAERIARNVVHDIGYEFPFEVIVKISRQSPDIAQGVVRETLELMGAGDQGMMFGYATDETLSLMPLPITLAHRLTKHLSEARKNGTLPFLLPDGKAQVTVAYENNAPVFVTAVTIAAQHLPSIAQEELRERILQKVIRPSLITVMKNDTKVFINATGRFVEGGPAADCGLTGRKIIADTYGGFGAHGGGSFSGKDPSKVDRSAAYMARYIAKNIVASGIAKKAEVRLAYTIGVADPMQLSVRTFGEKSMADERLLNKRVREMFDVRPGRIIRAFDLLRPIYRQISCYGHFGRLELDLPWEKTDKTEDLKKIFLA